MNTSSLKLNDFESFENFLFSEEERKLLEDEKWKKYIISDNTGVVAKQYFSPPIQTFELKSVEEYQLCHYAYWTCIGIFNPTLKMNFLIVNNKVPVTRCYACAYTRNHATTLVNCSSCPLQNHSYDCIPPYVKWSKAYSICTCRKHAFEIATWPWVKGKKDEKDSSS